MASIPELKYPRGTRVKLDDIIPPAQSLGASLAIISNGLNKPYNVHPIGDFATVPT